MAACTKLYKKIANNLVFRGHYCEAYCTSTNHNMHTDCCINLHKGSDEETFTLEESTAGAIGRLNGFRSWKWELNILRDVFLFSHLSLHKRLNKGRNC